MSECQRHSVPPGYGAEAWAAFIRLADVVRRDTGQPKLLCTCPTDFPTRHPVEDSEPEDK